ncbi:piggyBac transposable element-derived protein 4-like [Liolophura sinensis]|uniref:piggyBac transposable element-derived protein 4-like n=1 Tax=Liolophura sinensis TaxID=3198878 RepID=UPI00315931EA
MKRRSRLRSWKDTDNKEVYTFIGILLNMGIVQLPSVQSYWSTEWTSHVPFFAKAMNRDRFLLLYHTMLHVCSTDPNHRTRGDKIQPLVTKLVNKFQHYFVPYKNISADESMIGFKGRVIFRQYVPKKPVKWGILARTLADGETGYMCNINIYYGRDGEAEPDDNLTKTSRSVMKLIEPYLDKGYHIFADRLYNSVELAKALYNRNTYLTGTILLNRKGIPNELKGKRWKRGDRKALRCDNVMVTNWVDKRCVTLISTCYNGNETVEKQIKGRDTPVVKPNVVEKYNCYMGGVDKCDQLNQYYSFARRSLKWYKKVFFWLIELCAINSYILYKLSRNPPIPKKKLTLLVFRKQLVTGLVSLPVYDDHSPPPPKRGRPMQDAPLERLDGRLHVLGKIDDGKQRKCVVCSAKGNRSESVHYCSTCGSHPALHPAPCFGLYHTKKNY